MKHYVLATVAFLLSANAFAEECVARTESHEGKSYDVETCVAVVDDVIRANVDGYLQINYIVKYKGQRLVVEDPLAKSDHALGGQVSFVVVKLGMPPDSRSQGFRTLNATVYEPKAPDKSNTR